MLEVSVIFSGATIIVPYPPLTTTAVEVFIQLLV